MPVLNKVQGEPFSPERWVHQRFIFLPRTIAGTDPYYTAPDIWDERGQCWCRGIREDFDDAAFEHLERALPHGRWADIDAWRCHTLGA